MGRGTGIPAVTDRAGDALTPHPMLRALNGRSLLRGMDAGRVPDVMPRSRRCACARGTLHAAAAAGASCRSWRSHNRRTSRCHPSSPPAPSPSPGADVGGCASVMNHLRLCRVRQRYSQGQRQVRSRNSRVSLAHKSGRAFAHALMHCARKARPGPSVGRPTPQRGSARRPEWNGRSCAAVPFGLALATL